MDDVQQDASWSGETGDLIQRAQQGVATTRADLREAKRVVENARRETTKAGEHLKDIQEIVDSTWQTIAETNQLLQTSTDYRMVGGAFNEAR